MGRSWFMDPDRKLVSHTFIESFDLSDICSVLSKDIRNVNHVKTVELVECKAYTIFMRSNLSFLF